MSIIYPRCLFQWSWSSVITGKVNLDFSKMENWTPNSLLLSVSTTNVVININSKKFLIAERKPIKKPNILFLENCS